MSNEDFSYKRFYKIPNEKGTEVKKNINFQSSGFDDENNFNEKMDTKIGQNENNY